MNLYLACFDITDDGNRTRVGKHLAVYGQRVQRSVFFSFPRSSVGMPSGRSSGRWRHAACSHWSPEARSSAEQIR